MGRWFYIINKDKVTKKDSELLCNEHGVEVTHCCLPNFGWDDLDKFKDIAPIITSFPYTTVSEYGVGIGKLRARLLSDFSEEEREIWIVKDMLTKLENFPDAARSDKFEEPSFTVVFSKDRDYFKYNTGKHLDYDKYYFHADFD
uniref:Uncharacterized protein n=1 Tax=Pithovirus LCPAC406 TaxID=2506599 RepID=A0A481ZEY7_9VIRU|nr:MAG: hypothetical protein LCPAC406_00760 [Pithovirus LCPAC406]